MYFTSLGNWKNFFVVNALLSNSLLVAPSFWTCRSCRVATVSSCNSVQFATVSCCDRRTVGTVYNRFALSRLCTTDSVHGSLVFSRYQRRRVESTQCTVVHVYTWTVSSRERLCARLLSVELLPLVTCQVDNAHTRIESTRRSFLLVSSRFVSDRSCSVDTVSSRLLLSRSPPKIAEFVKTVKATWYIGATMEDI